MHRIAIVLMATATLPTAAIGQDWRGELASDLVRVVDGKLTYEEYGILRITLAGYEPYSAQVKLYAEAPADGVISRDNFVGYTATLVTTLLMAGYAEAFQVSASTFMQGMTSVNWPTPLGIPMWRSAST